MYIRLLELIRCHKNGCRHVVMHFVLPALEHRSREDLHLTLYSCTTAQPDAFTSHLQSLADAWVDLAPLPPDQVLRSQGLGSRV